MIAFRHGERVIVNVDGEQERECKKTFVKQAVRIQGKGLSEQKKLGRGPV